MVLGIFDNLGLTFLSGSCSDQATVTVTRVTPGSVPGRVIGPGSGSGPPAPRLSPRLRVGSDLRASPIICASVHVSSQNAHLTAINLGGNMSQSETFLTKSQMVKYDVANIF